MTDKECIDILLNDLRSIGIKTTGFDLYLRKYSKTYWGRYFPKTMDRPTPRIYLYAHTPSGGFYNHDILLYHLIHECVHHEQYASATYVRFRGIMHDSDFIRLFQRYIKRAVKKNLINMKNVRGRNYA